MHKGSCLVATYWLHLQTSIVLLQFSSGVGQGDGVGVYHNVYLGGCWATSPPRSHFMVCGVLWTNLTWERRREG